MQVNSFFVHGTPAPGGSKNAFVPRKKDGSPVTRANGSIMVNMVDAGKNNKKWREVVAWYARGFMGGRKPFKGPIKVEFVFFIRRPEAHYRTGGFSHMLRPDAPAFHIQAPDALKLARSTEDACTGIIWEDDSQNIVGRQEKRWCSRKDDQGCAIRFELVHVDTPLFTPSKP